MSKASQILNQYTFNISKPKKKVSGVQIYDAVHKQTTLPYTIKILANPDYKLEQYLIKIKETSSQNVIKIYEFAFETSQNRLVIVQQNTQYGTLKDALTKCKRFDNDDAVFISKILLNGHIDLLRNGITWFGSQQDIQFTQNGMKLSWNNSVPYIDKSPFQFLLARISERDGNSTILPFPPNKMMIDLIAVSKQNASQISLHPILKKKQKLFKKKGKNWIAIKQTKIKGEYFQELSYLAVSSQFGLVRIKVMEEGQVDEQLMKIYQTKASFVKILDYYTQKGQFITISQYANDGTVQNYVKRLKSSNVGLKQNQIQFFFFSLIQPLKFIHESTVKSFNTLNIRNIYIQNGIPKIGEPTPLNNKIKQILIDRADVPDFYHTDFKKDPSLRNPVFDTYSLGVLLYKLMYTQYPIFPQEKVHIPTAPNYKKNLKSAIQLFLNIGGSLQELEKQLQISDDVKIQVKNNEKILEQQVIRRNNSKQTAISEQKVKEVAQSELQFREDRDKEHHHDGCCVRLWKFLTVRGKDPKGKYSTIYNSQFDNYRKCTTVFLVLLFYFFAFFLFFMNGVVNLFNYTRVFTPYSINILGQTQKIITPNFDHFMTEYAKVANNSVLVLNQTMNCRIDNKLYYYDFIRNQSPHWNIYLCLGIITLIVILTLKGIQLCKYSTVKAGFHHYDTTISGTNLSRYAISSYVFFQLWFSFALYAFYYLFNYVFHEQHSPCFGGTNWTKLTQVLMLYRVPFVLKYLIALCIIFFFALLSFIHVTNYSKLNYNMLKNPIFIFTPFYLALMIALRIGAYTQFVPSFVSNSQNIIGSSYLDVIGYFPEIMVLIQVGLCLVIDQIYYKFIFEKLNKFVIDQSFNNDLKIDS